MNDVAQGLQFGSESCYLSNEYVSTINAIDLH